MPGYLDMSMEGFAKNQEAMRNRLAEAFGGSQPGDREPDAPEHGDVRARHVDVLAPSCRGQRRPGGEDEARPNGATDAKGRPSEDISELKSEIEAMRKQLAELSQRR